jgi:hypothetical protein
LPVRRGRLVSLKVRYYCPRRTRCLRTGCWRCDTSSPTGC